MYIKRGRAYLKVIRYQELKISNHRKFILKIKIC